MIYRFSFGRIAVAVFAVFLTASSPALGRREE